MLIFDLFFNLWISVSNLIVDSELLLITITVCLILSMIEILLHFIYVFTERW